MGGDIYPLKNVGRIEVQQHVGRLLSPEKCFSSAKYNNSSHSGGGDNPCEGVIDTSSYVPLSFLGPSFHFTIWVKATSTANDNSDRLAKLESKVKRTAPPNHCERRRSARSESHRATNEGTKTGTPSLARTGMIAFTSAL